MDQYAPHMDCARSDDSAPATRRGVLGGFPGHIPGGDPCRRERPSGVAGAATPWGPGTRDRHAVAGGRLRHSGTQDGGSHGAAFAGDAGRGGPPSAASNGPDGGEVTLPRSGSRRGNGTVTAPYVHRAHGREFDARGSIGAVRAGSCSESAEGEPKYPPIWVCEPGGKSGEIVTKRRRPRPLTGDHATAATQVVHKEIDRAGTVRRRPGSSRSVHPRTNRHDRGRCFSHDSTAAPMGARPHRESAGRPSLPTPAAAGNPVDPGAGQCPVQSRLLRTCKGTCLCTSGARRFLPSFHEQMFHGHVVYPNPTVL